MNDHEKKRLDVERADIDGAPIPADAIRRKVAKAVLSAPVVMTLAPRAVFGLDGPGPCGSVLTSVTLGSRPDAEGIITQCEKCVEDYLGNTQCALPDDGGAAEQEALDQCALSDPGQCRTPASSVQNSLFQQEFAPQGDLLASGSQDCIPQATTTQVAPQPVVSQPTTLSRREQWLQRRSGTSSTTTQPSSFQASTAQPSAFPSSTAQPSTYTSGSTLSRREQWLSRRSRTSTVTASAPQVTAPQTKQTIGCSPQPVASAPAPVTTSQPTTRMSRRDLWNALRGR